LAARGAVPFAPMPESRDLAAARRQLAAGEALYESADGLAAIDEGLALLEDVVELGSASDARTAQNLAATYAARLYERVGVTLSADRAVPEPALEHFFKLVLVFDRFAAALPANAHALKIDVVRRLIDRYCEGHPPEKKRAMLAQLDALEEPQSAAER
jgi:hypothetical protein